MVSQHKLVFNYIRKNSNLRVEKLGRHHLNQVIKVHTTNNVTKWYHVPLA